MNRWFARRPATPEQRAALLATREEALHQMIRGTVAVALLALVTNTISSLAYPDWASTGLYGAIFLVLCVLALARRLPFVLRGAIFVGLLFAVGLVSLLTLGLAGAGRLYLLAFAVIATAVFGSRAGVLAAVLALATWLLAAAGFSTGLLAVTEPNDPALFLNWLAGAMSLLLVMVGLMIPQRQFLETRLFAVSTSREKAALEAAQARLSQETAALEAATREADAARREQEAQARALQRRAALLTLSAEVAHAAAAVHNVDDLLRTSVSLISQRFNFYHTGLFLLDDAREWAVLSAASSPGGQRLLAHGHRLRVGHEGIVGNVASTGQPRIALDVGADAAHLTNPELTATRSEMAVPLRARDVILGVLDVQSEATQAFAEEDAQVLQSLADQIGLALDNARLLQETQQRLAELQALQHGARREAGLAGPETPAAYRYDGVEVRPLAGPLPPGPDASALRVPLRFGDQLLGELELNRAGEPWSADDLELTAAIADRMALALESAQLFEQTRARAQQLAALSETTLELTGPQFNTQQVLEQLCRGAQRIFAVDHAGIWLPAGRDELELRVAHGASEASPPALGQRLRVGAGLAGQTFSTGQPLRTAASADWAQASAGAEALPPTHAALSVPMAWQGQPLGVLVLSLFAPGRTFTADEERIALLYAAQGASTLENARLFAETQQRLAELSTINAISQALSTHLDLTTMIEVVVDTLRQAFNRDNAYLALYDPVANQISIPYMVDGGQRTHVPPFPLGEGLTSLVIQTRQPLHINHDADRRVAELGAKVTGRPARSFLAVPVLAGAEVLGVISVQDLDQEHAFSDADVRLLGTIAANVGVALQNARLFEETQRRAEQLATAADVSRTAISVLNPDDLIVQSVELIRERFARTAGVHYAALFLLDETKTWARLRHATGEAGRTLLQRRHQLEVGGQSMVGWATANRRARIALDVGVEPVRFANPLVPDTRSEIALPLVVGDSVLGALDVQSTRSGAFSQADLAVLQTMVDQIAIALRNAQLLAATQRTQAFLDSVIENLPSMLFVKDAQDLRFVRWNRAAESLIGLTSDETVGKTDSDIFPVDEAQHFFSKDREVLEARRMVEIAEEPIQTRGQGRRWLHTRKIPIMDEAGQPQFLLGISEDITERKAADERLRTAEERYRSLVEQLPAIIYAVEVPAGETVGRTTYISPQVESLLGYSPAEWLADPQLWIKLLHPEDHDTVLQAVARQNAVGSTLDLEYRSLTRDGRVIWFHNQSQAYFDDTGQALLARGIMFDITARKQAETALKAAQETAQRRAQLLAAAADVARAMSGSLERDELLRASVNLIRERFGYYHAAVFTVEPGSRMAVLQEATGDIGALLKARAHQLGVGSQSLVGRATAARQPVVVQDVSAEPTHFKNPLLPETRAEAVLPLLSGASVIGALDVQSTWPNAFGAEDVAILVTIADQLSVALQNAQLFDQTARRARRERLVVEITSKIRAAGDMDGMLRTAVTELRQALGVSRAAVRLDLPGGSPALQQRRGTGPLRDQPGPGQGALGRNGAHRANGAGGDEDQHGAGGSQA